jgi:hypothetical protein
VKNEIKVGDVVLYRNRKRKSKFDQKWIGPYVVVAISKVGSVKMKNLKNEQIVVSHLNDIKIMYEDVEFKKEICVVKELQEDLKKISDGEL